MNIFLLLNILQLMHKFQVYVPYNLFSFPFLFSYRKLRLKINIYIAWSFSSTAANNLSTSLYSEKQVINNSELSGHERIEFTIPKNILCNKLLNGYWKKRSYIYKLDILFYILTIAIFNAPVLTNSFWTGRYFVLNNVKICCNAFNLVSPSGGSNVPNVVVNLSVLKK